MGNLLAVVVHAANIHDTKAGILVAKKAFEVYPSIQRFCADAGYRKTFEQNISNVLGLGVDISVRIKPEWEVLPKRWIVERSLAWINNSRRLSKDYEISVCSAQAVVQPLENFIPWAPLEARFSTPENPPEETAGQAPHSAVPPR